MTSGSDVHFGNGKAAIMGRIDSRITATLRHLTPVGTVDAPSLKKVHCKSGGSVNEGLTPQHPHDNDWVAVPAEFRCRAHIRSRDQYETMWRHSIEDPDRFWGGMAEEFHWERKWDTRRSVVEANFDVRKGPIAVKWFSGGRTNICYNCVDRHVAAGRGSQVALLWEGNNRGCDARITFSELKARICQVANFLRSVGVRKGDTVGIYMPMVAELPIAMLACARIGAVHSVRLKNSTES